ALATEVILFSVAGSITSKRAPSEDFFHLPPIQRSVGTFASRFSYMAVVPVQTSRLACPFTIYAGTNVRRVEDAVRSERSITMSVYGVRGTSVRPLPFSKRTKP